MSATTPTREVPEAATSMDAAQPAWRRRSPLTDHQRMLLLEPLARGRTLHEAAAAAAVPLDAAGEAARQAGHPDVVEVHRTWIQLRRQVGLAETAPSEPARPAESGLVHHLVTASTGPRLVRVPLEQLHPDSDNPREELPDIEEMAASLQEVGMLQPIVVRIHQRRLVIVMGHRRYAGACKLGWSHVVVLVNPEIRPEDVLLAMLTENAQRCDLDPIEEALAVRRLIHEQKLATHAQAAARLGRHSTSWVSSRLALLDLSAREQELVRSRHMTLREAVARARQATGRTHASAPATPYFGAAHPLAASARAHCRSTHLHATRLPGGVACGGCWEAVIRRDETTVARQPGTTPPARAS